MLCGNRLVGGLFWSGLLGLIGCGAPAAAQSLRDLRIDLHPLGNQVGIVTRAVERTAWITLPHSVKVGASVAFSPYSDGGDTMASGTVRWVAPIAPYEAYVTDIKTTTTRHPVNDANDLAVTSVVTGATKNYGTRAEDDQNGVYLAINFFARTPAEPATLDTEGVEPVAAYISALRALSSKTARDLADAAERALLPNAAVNEDSVDYSLLFENLHRFRRMKMNDPIVEHILNRLYTIAQESGSVGSVVPIDFLRPPDRSPSGTQRRP